MSTCETLSLSFLRVSILREARLDKWSALLSAQADDLGVQAAAISEEFARLASLKKEPSSGVEPSDVPREVSNDLREDLVRGLKLVSVSVSCTPCAITIPGD